MPDQKNNANKVPRCFSVMWVPKLLQSPVRIRIFCPKTAKYGPKLAFLVNLGQAMQAYSMPCCGSVGGCGARAVSRKTPIYFIDTSPMRTTKTPPTLSMLSSFASVFLFVSCNRRIRSGLHQMTQLLNKKRTNFANTLLSIEEDDDDDHNEVMM